MVCNRDTERCPYIADPANHYSKDPINECCLANLKEMLRDLAEIFNQANLHYWLDYGSLLGSVRSGDLIPWDKDIDWGLLNKDLKQICDLAPKIESMGYQFVYPLTEYSLHPRIHFSKTNHLHSDIYLWDTTPDGEHYHMVGHPSSHGSPVRTPDLPDYFHMCPKDFYDTLSSIRAIKIPNHVEDYLRLRYGKEWRIPDPDFYIKWPGGIGIPENLQ